jgi:NADH-quinone oxidoreductase subunit N
MPDVTFPSIHYVTIVPHLIVIGLACVLMVLDAITRRSRAVRAGQIASAISIIGYGAALASLLFTYNHRQTTANGSIRFDYMAIFFLIVMLSTAILTVLVSANFVQLQSMSLLEYLVILSFAVLGMMVVAIAGDLVMVFIGIELSSIAVYVLAGFSRQSRIAHEGALKYFLLGAFATAILIYGMAWTFGITGAINLDVIATAGAKIADGNPSLLLALLLLVVGLGFKIAAVPFHMWTPDAYHGAPTPVTAFMSVGPKAAGFAAMIRILVNGWTPAANQWVPLVIVLAVITMSFGNIVAVAQNNVKRMLAYSSIAHTGYMLVGLASYQVGANKGDANGQAIGALLFYTFAYAFTNIGAFSIITWMQARGRGTNIDSFRGLASTAPGAAIAMTIFMVSLMGVPPLLGFFAKYYIIVAAINANLTWLAVVVAVNSAVSAYFYLRVVAVMYFREPDRAVVERRTPWLGVGLTLSAIATVLFGIFSGPVFDLARKVLLG